MLNFIWVGVGGSIGAVLRYLAGRVVQERWSHRFPLSTFLINVSGAFILGVLTRFCSEWFAQSMSTAMLFLGTGLCGAYTTFSTFSYEAWMLFREGRNLTAIAYFFSTITCGIAAAAVGLYGVPPLF